MARALGDRPLGNTWNGTLRVIRTVNELSHEEVTLSRSPGGKVASFNVDRDLWWAPAGSEGPEQRCVLDGNMAIFRPKRNVTFAVAFLARIPR